MACLSAGVFFGALISFVLSPIIVDMLGWRSVSGMLRTVVTPCVFIV